MKIERQEGETDAEWDERLAEEIAMANNSETTHYFVERDPYDEAGVIINYVGGNAMTWKEHPEGPFKATLIIEWKNKAEQWDKVCTAMKKTVTDIESSPGGANISQIVVHQILSAYLQAMGEEVQSSTQTANKGVEE